MTNGICHVAYGSYLFKIDFFYNGRFIEPCARVGRSGILNKEDFIAFLVPGK
jgi:hypothetical protein